jgi:hypothetical protein
VAGIVGAGLLDARAASATIAVPVPETSLAADAEAIVVGRVTRIASRWDAGRGQILTSITVDVHEVLKGQVGDAGITVRQVGGTVGDLVSWVHGSPEFERGEWVLLFLDAHADGTPRIAHLYQGKFSITADASTGEILAHRDPNPHGVHVLRPRGAAPRDLWRLDDLKALVRQHAARGGGRRRLRPDATVDPAVTETTGSFTFIGRASRWFEPDDGQPVVMYTNQDGEPSAPTRGFDQVRDALAAWSAVAGASLRMEDGGFTTARGIVADGVNTVSFRDPLRQVSPPSDCHGILAVGGFFGSTRESRSVNGKTFYRIVEGDTTMNDGWDGCGTFYETYANFAEVVTHELGHVLGFDHSRDATATMYSRAHFDGRGASLMADDMAGVRFAYPAGLRLVTLTVALDGAGGTVTSVPAGIACGATCRATFAGGSAVTLTARATGGAVFAGWTGACSGTGPCTLALETDTTVVARFAVPDLQVTAVGDPPAALARGGRFPATATVTNTGSVPAGASRLRYYLSADGSRGPGDVLLGGSRSVSRLAAGASSTGAVTVTTPPTIAPGDYFLLACADDTAAVAETSEANNCRVSAAAVRIGLPDLVVSAVDDPPASAAPGARFEVSDTTFNQGTVLAAASTTRYYVALSRVRGSGDRMIGSHGVPALAAGAGWAGRATLAIPSALPAGAYFLLACADDLRRVAEAGDPANNCRAAASPVSVASP